MTVRVVFDTTTVVSALCFPSGRLAWLRIHWRERHCIPLLSAATAAELLRVLKYPKFRLSAGQQQELLAQYIPFCELVAAVRAAPLVCRDRKDQPFLDLAWTASAAILITGDQDLLSVPGTRPFVVETPGAYRQRIIQDLTPDT